MARFAGHQGDGREEALSPDGRLLASGSDDTGVLVWDATGRKQQPQPETRPLPAADWDELWADLAAKKAATAYRAVWALADAPQVGVPLLAEHLLPQLPDAARLARLLGDPDSEQFTVREKAGAELVKLSEVAEPALRRALAAKPSPEATRRLQDLLDRLAQPQLRLRHLRAVETLEVAGTAEARRLLRELAERGPGASLRQEAKDSLKRLSRRPDAATPSKQ